jgi:hypothetical protein
MVCSRGVSLTHHLKEMKLFSAKAAAVTEASAAVEPIKSIDDWYLVTNGLSAFCSQILAMERGNDQGVLDDQLLSHRTMWMDLVRRSVTAENAYLHHIIRNKAYAFSVVYASGTGDEDLYHEAFFQDIFATENAFLKQHFNEDEGMRQHNEGYDKDLSLYIQALAGYYCNPLLNLADGGDREVCNKDHLFYKKLIELTPKLEEREMFNEFYVARTAVIHAYSSFAHVWLRPTEEKIAWEDEAHQMLMELYAAPVRPAACVK